MHMQSLEKNDIKQHIQTLIALRPKNVKVHMHKNTKKYNERTMY